MRNWWQIVWLVAQGQLATQVAQGMGGSPYWRGQLAKRYMVLSELDCGERSHALVHGLNAGG
jgi:hypothetical protein